MDAAGTIQGDAANRLIQAAQVQCGQPLDQARRQGCVAQPRRPTAERPPRAGLRRAAPLRLGRKSKADRAGLRVSELNAEITRRDGDRQGELAEELPGDAADERAGHEDRAQDQAHGDHRPGDLAHGLDRGLLGRQAGLDVVLHGLDHHDRVVDDDADGQHQAEEREVVEAETHGRHHGEGADDGHRHGDQRNHADRQFCRNRSTTKATSSTASRSVTKTSLIDSVMKGVVS